jgi:methyl-accepting chemotaxis protein
MDKTKNRRKLRNLLIRKEIQLELVLLNLFLMAVSAGVIILVVLTPVYDGFQSSDNVWVQHVSAKLFLLITDRLLVSVGAILALGMVYTLIISHRFCGPLANFCHTFQRISQGDLTRKVNLRRYDFLKHEAEQINDMIDGLSLRLDVIRQEQHAIKSKIEELSASEAQCAARSHLLSELASVVQACDKAIGEVKTR